MSVMTVAGMGGRRGAWPRRPEASSGRKRAAGARVANVGDLVDRHVGQGARQLADLADVDERLDDVVRLRVEAEASARAVELRRGDGGDQLVLVLGVAVHRLQ